MNQNLQNIYHHVYPLLVEQMLFVKNKMELDLAYVFQNILEIRMKDVVQNVL